MTETVGLRELQQNASAVVRRAVEGESVGITDRGRLVARLVPVTDDPYADLIAAGAVRVATRALADIGAPLTPVDGATASTILAGQREHER